MKLINLSATNCKNCYKCVRVCPVKAIRFSNDKAEIDEDRCIACGHCFVVCPQNARNIKSDIKLLETALDLNKNTVACIAPSFAGFFDEPGKFVAGLKKLGFKSVQEVSVGALKVTQTYDSYIRQNNPKYAISSCCSTINLLVRKYYPDLSKYLLPVVTPMMALAKAIKKETPDCFSIFISPCISKKHEAADENYKGFVDAIITYEEILELFNKFEIDINSLEPIPPDRTGEEIGRKYPISGGIANGLTEVLTENNYDIIHVEGTDNAIKILENIQSGKLEKSYIEISACVESCISGPCSPKNADGVYVRKQKVKNFIANGWSIMENSVDWSDIDLTAKDSTQPVELNLATEEDIISILKKMGKNKKEDELNCSACGYDTCRKKAQAVYEGMSQIEMCMPYMRIQAETMNDIIFFNSPNSIFMLDKGLNILQMNPAAEKAFQARLENIKGKSISIFMNTDDLEKVVDTKINILNKKTIYSKYGYIAMQSIIYLEDTNHILMIMANITDEDKRKKELEKLKQNTIEVAQNVIENQMRVAHEIASLLGETTAETKVALNKLKQIVLEEGE